MKFLITADVHFETLRLEDLHLYIDYWKECINQQPDLFFIAGDLVDDRNLKAESPVFLSLLKFITEISDYCKEKQIPLIVLRGTMSHDGDVVKTLHEIIPDKFIYIDSICRKVWKNTSFFMIPEPYFPTYQEFYDTLVKARTSAPVDYVIFHGMMDFAIPQLKQQDSRYKLSRSIIMKTNDILEHCNYIAIGGHVHSFLHTDRIYYTQMFVNRPGHMSEIPYYGIKLVEGNTVTNLRNPYMIQHRVFTYDFHDMTNQEIEAIIKDDRKIVDVIYIYRIRYDIQNETHRRYFKELQNQVGHLFVKRVIDTQEEPSISVEQVKATTIIPEDILQDMYQKKFQESIPNSILLRLKGESETS